MNAARQLQFPVSENEQVSALLLVPDQPTALFVLAHGAGAGMHHPFMNAIANELAFLNIATFRYQFPYMEHRRGVPDKQPLLLATVAAAVKTAAESAAGLPLFAGGKSMGGRMTSLAAAQEILPGVRGIIFVGFPLHPPKRPSIKRAEHIYRVNLPILFLQGTRDDLADLSLLRPICAELGAQATLHILDGADHSFHVLKRSGKTGSQILTALAQTIRAWTTTRAHP